MLKGVLMFEKNEKHLQRHSTWWTSWPRFCIRSSHGGSSLCEQALAQATGFPIPTALCRYSSATQKGWSLRKLSLYKAPPGPMVTPAPFSQAEQSRAQTCYWTSQTAKWPALTEQEEGNGVFNNLFLSTAVPLIPFSSLFLLLRNLMNVGPKCFGNLASGWRIYSLSIAL